MSVRYLREEKTSIDFEEIFVSLYKVVKIENICEGKIDFD